MIHTEVIATLDVDTIEEKDAFIVIDDNNLVDIVTLARTKNWQLGHDIGLLSYNETNLKSIIANGITTITTDFTAMGQAMANMILAGKGEVIENPFVIIDRQSF